MKLRANLYNIEATPRKNKLLKGPPFTLKLKSWRQIGNETVMKVEPHAWPHETALITQPEQKLSNVRDLFSDIPVLYVARDTEAQYEVFNLRRKMNKINQCWWTGWYRLLSNGSNAPPIPLDTLLPPPPPPLNYLTMCRWNGGETA